MEHADVVRSQTLLEESREAVIVIDDLDRVVGASRRARQSIPGLREGERIPDGLLVGRDGPSALVIPYDVAGRRERLVYISQAGDLTAYEELRAGFTAAVSHELRTPLARLLAILETAALPGEDVAQHIEAARAEVEYVTELIDEILFLSELESGARAVSLGAVAVLPELEAAAADLEERGGRAGVNLVAKGDPTAQVEIRARLLRVIADNLAENSLRYAGPGTTCTLSVQREEAGVVVRVRDNGVGVQSVDLPRLFERFFRADRARSSRGTGLGLAIVKHIVTQAGGTVEAFGAPGAGLEVACTFPPARQV